MLGDGVNVASRIHALVPSGGISISERVYDEIRNKPEMRAKYIGKKRLKNVSRPIPIYALTAPDATLPASESTAWKPGRRAVAAATVGLILAAGAYVAVKYLPNFGPSPATRGSIRSIAVLPLANLSGDPTQEYFADGMTDELTTDLAQIGDLRVTSRTSAVQFKNTSKSLPQIAKELHVDAVLEGSVVRLGDRLRITAQLIEGRTDRHLWAKSYERASRDVLALQDELASDIADGIRVELSANARTRLATTRAVDPEAHDLYLRGRFFWNARTEESVVKAQGYFQQAIAKDPLFAPAYSGLADAYFYRGYIWGHLPPREAMPLARAAALKAIELDENSAEGHTSLAMIKFFYDWDFKGAEQEFRRAISLNPNYATAHHFLAINLVALGRNDEALAEARAAVEADPLSVPVNNILGETLSEAGRYDEAIAQYRKTLELDPNSVLVHNNLSGCDFIKGQLDEAFGESIKSLIAAGAGTQDVEALRKVYKASGWPGVYEAGLQFALARWNKDHWHVDAYQIGVLHALLGQQDQTFEWFDKCLELRSGTMTWLYLGDFPWLLKLRADPRFTEIQRKVEASP
jgi:TolB-like protein/Flp pilus assembly protein TadD